MTEKTTRKIEAGTAKANIVVSLMGMLERGENLPPRRTFAASLGMSPGTLNVHLWQLRKLGAVEIEHPRIYMVQAEIVPPKPKPAPAPKPKPAPRKRIGPSTREKMIALVKHCDWEGKQFPKLSVIATAFGVPYRTVRAVLEDLREDGTIWHAAYRTYRMTDAGK